MRSLAGIARNCTLIRIPKRPENGYADNCGVWVEGWLVFDVFGDGVSRISLMNLGITPKIKEDP